MPNLLPSEIAVGTGTQKKLWCEVLGIGSSDGKPSDLDLEQKRDLAKLLIQQCTEFGYAGLCGIAEDEDALAFWGELKFKTTGQIVFDDVDDEEDDDQSSKEQPASQ